MLATILMLACCHLAHAGELDVLHERRRATQQVGMGVLGGWATVNIAAGTVGALTADSERMRWFHASNAMWNGVNLGLAIPGLVGANRERVGTLSSSELLLRSRQREKVFLVNAGIDVGYVMTGFFLREHGLRVDDERFVGVGEALWVQGGFLAVFDVAMFALASSVSRDIHLTLMPGGVALRF